ncbi:MAG: hypothetical protein O9346_08935 [Leptospiraceae bacterium]|nr:hypothetical protein [Leptospiraceae bacterium]MCZ8346527.1 hypothetical protein [Leptospiraceae bacterium]
MKKFSIYLFIIAILNCQSIILDNERILSKSNKIDYTAYFLNSTLFSADLLGIKTENDKYKNNQFVGYIKFSGGIDYERAEDGSELVTTKNIDLTYGSGDYRKDISDYLSSEFDLIQSSWNILFNKLELNFKNEKDFIRAKDIKIELNQKDSVNSPYLIYSFKDSLVITEIPKGKSGLLFIPVVHAYYAHTAGWFRDQTWGTSPGVRLILSLVAYDLSTGKKVSHYLFDEKVIKPVRYSMNTNELKEAKIELFKMVSIKINAVMKESID